MYPDHLAPTSIVPVVHALILITAKAGTITDKGTSPEVESLTLAESWK